MKTGTMVEAIEDITIIDENLATRLAVPKGTIGEVVREEHLFETVFMQVDFPVGGKKESILMMEDGKYCDPTKSIREIKETGIVT